METIKIILIIALPVFAAIISWRVSNYFISKKEHYQKSKYDIFFKKAGWSLFWLVFTAIVAVQLFGKK